MGFENHLCSKEEDNDSWDTEGEEGEDGGVIMVPDTEWEDEEVRGVKSVSWEYRGNENYLEEFKEEFQNTPYF